MSTAVKGSIKYRKILPKLGVMPSFGKFCVFCGNPPETKNKEHIIPRWLLRMTGDENRKIGFHFDKKKGAIVPHGASAYVFPACTRCNTAYSDLENVAMKFIQAVVSSTEVTEQQFSAFFDWIDKIRVGLWLADITRNKDDVIIGNKNFHINDRVGQKDRCLFIFKAADFAEGINTIGTMTTIFHYWPSAFGLRINGLYFINVSSDFIFAHRMGLANFKNPKYHSGNAITGDLTEGNKRIKVPFLDIKIVPPHLSYFQSCYPSIGSNDPDDTKKKFLTEYGSKIHLIENKFKIFKGDGSMVFPDGSEKFIVPVSPLKSLDSDFLMPYVSLKTLELQTLLAENRPDYFDMDKEGRDRYRHNSREAIRSNKDGQRRMSQKLVHYSPSGVLKDKKPWEY